MTPPANDVFRRCCYSPIPFFCAIAMILGIISILVIQVIGYYSAYSEVTPVGLCVSYWPSLRRTCILDMTGSVMAVIVAFLILMFELASAYINRRDWKLAFISIKMILIFITLIVLIIAAVYGGMAYKYFCSKSHYCKFSHRDDSNKETVDFIVIIVAVGMCAIWWGIMFFVECLRGIVTSSQRTREVSIYSSELRPVATADMSEDRQPLLSETALPDYD